MGHARIVAGAVLGAVALLSASPAWSGQWITPDWPAGKEPQFKPVPLYWFEVKDCPLVYRTEVDVPKQADRATVLLRTSGYVYVYVDARLAYGWAPQGEDRRANTPAVPADRTRVHELDLGELLTPGRHVLTVSAPREGFVLDGALYAGTKRIAPLATDGKWTVTKFPPTTILEDEPIMTLWPDRKTPATTPEPAAVKTAEEWKADEDALAKAYFAALVKRAQRDLDDAVWRLELLAKKGIYVHNDAAYGWGGAGRYPEARKHASEGLVAAGEVRQLLARLAGQAVEGAAGLEKALPEMGSLRAAMKNVVGELESATNWAMRNDEAKALSAISSQFAGPWPSRVGPDDDVERLRREMESRLGPLNRLNDSRWDRLGWINHSGLTDSDIGRWGVRINPVTGPTKVRGPQRWLFSTDPTDQGVKEQRHTIGYNIEGQWPTIDGSRTWTADKRFTDYKGVAWYRGRIHIPGQWAGNEVELSVSVAGKEQLWLNESDVTKYATGEGKRTYKIPASRIAFGGENFLAFRIEADGQQRGLASLVEASCPAMEGEEGKKTPPVDVLATPLSPCVVLTLHKDELWIHHAGKGKLMMPGSGRPIIEMDKYAPQKPGKLFAGNWVLVWLAPAAAGFPQRPILLVFPKSPLSIACEEGVTRVRFAQAGERVIAVRPWAKTDLAGKKPEDVASAAAFWSQAALAVPVNYLCVTMVLKPGEDYSNISIEKVPAGPVLGHTYVYDYLESKDELGTQPIKIAPLPAFCSYALDCGFRGLKLVGPGKVEALQDGGMLAPYRGVRGADRIRYSYPIEPYPRFIGFTSWMFSGVDAGVPGNKREMELIAWTGANSYRPQTNWSDELPPKWFQDGNRTRVAITADYCNAAGINYMNNPDQTLGMKVETFVADYDKNVKVFHAHCEKLARQLHGKAFWQVAYDLINEAASHNHVKYNALLKELTAVVRAIDKTHLLYVEPCESWGAIQQIPLVEPTGDPLTVHSFHDYNFRLHKREDRWPTLEQDITNIYQMWMPALVYGIRHGLCMHCGEYGGFSGASDDSLAQKTLMNDFYRVFDQFGMHHHYYSGRSVFQRLADGSLRPSNVVRACREYFRTDPNRYYKKWEGCPRVNGNKETSPSGKP